MSAGEPLREADRVMTICNACRYCEGFCAVFPAMELRRTFAPEDLRYLANLCHNCRGCWYACQYAPPHEFAVNVPRALAELRRASWQAFARPKGFAGLFTRNGRTVWVAGLIAAALFLVWAALSAAGGLGARQAGAGAFYRVIPYGAMVGFFAALGLGALGSLGAGLVSFLRATGTPAREFFALENQRRGLRDVLRLTYLEGGGHGCNYPDERFRHGRRRLHHLVFYGFLAAFASTTVAAFYDHVLGIPAPYPWASPPVLLGLLGGLSMTAGLAGLLYLKARMDREPADEGGRGMEWGFLGLLLAVNVTGLLLLFLRETAAMGTMLSLHLAAVAAFFALLPYSKFVHALYRWAALVKNAAEQRKAG